MNRYNAQPFAKIIDRLTIESAPDEIKYHKEKCLEKGYLPLKFSTQSGNTKIYRTDQLSICESGVDINLDLYSKRVSELIRENYTIDEELAIQRQRNDDMGKFNAYYHFCESCKKKAKLEQIDEIVQDENPNPEA